MKIVVSSYDVGQRPSQEKLETYGNMDKALEAIFKTKDAEHALLCHMQYLLFQEDISRFVQWVDSKFPAESGVS